MVTTAVPPAGGGGGGGGAYVAGPGFEKVSYVGVGRGVAP